MRDLQERLRRHVDSAAPPIDVTALARRLAEEDRRRVMPTTLIKPQHVPAPPTRRRTAVYAFAAAVILIGAAIGGLIWLVGGDEPDVVATTVTSTSIPATSTTVAEVTTTTAASETTTTAPPTTTTAAPAWILPDGPFEAGLGDPPPAGPSSGEVWGPEELRQAFLDNRSQIPLVSQLEFEEVVPALGEGVGLLDSGSIAPDELSSTGRPHIVVVWSIPADIDEGTLHDLRYHLDRLELARRSYGDRFVVLSVLLDGSDARAAKEVVDRRGYEFRTVLRSPESWGIESSEVTPMWLLLDQSGALTSGFFAFHADPLPIELMISEYVDAHPEPVELSSSGSGAPLSPAEIYITRSGAFPSMTLRVYSEGWRGATSTCFDLVQAVMLTGPAGGEVRVTSILVSDFEPGFTAIEAASVVEEIIDGDAFTGVVSTDTTVAGFAAKRIEAVVADTSYLSAFEWGRGYWTPDVPAGTEVVMWVVETGIPDVLILATPGSGTLRDVADHASQVVGALVITPGEITECHVEPAA